MTPLIIPAFIAGLITFLAPCTLPLVPAYLTFIGGASVKDLNDKEREKKRKAKVFLNGLFFVLGFSIVFITLGLFAGALGGLLIQGRIWLSRIGGILVIFFGLIMLNIINIQQLSSPKKLSIDMNKERRGAYGFSFLLGVVFGSGWTPCIGPILGSILIIAGSSATALEGGILLAVFSLGLAIPFLLIAFGISKSEKLIEKYSDKLGFITKIAGLFIICLGILLFTNNLYFLSTWGYKLFEFINYESLINYL